MEAARTPLAPVLEDPVALVVAVVVVRCVPMDATEEERVVWMERVLVVVVVVEEPKLGSETLPLRTDPPPPCAADDRFLGIGLTLFKFCVSIIFTNMGNIPGQCAIGCFASGTKLYIANN